MRLRTIKPDFWKNEKLAELSHGARLLFIGLWNLADGWGMLEDRPKRIRAELFPYDAHLTSDDINDMLQALAAHGFIERYEPDGVPLIYIPGFRRHQIVQMHVRERDAKARWPFPAGQAPDKHRACTVQDRGEHGADPAGNASADKDKQSELNSSAQCKHGAGTVPAQWVDGYMGKRVNGEVEGRLGQDSPAASSAHFSNGGDKQPGEDRAHAMLAKYGMRTEPKAMAEWVGHINKIVRCKSVEECGAYLNFVCTAALKAGVRIEYARECSRLAQEWNEYGRKAWQKTQEKSA